jgi:hypothetical protein
MEREEQETMDVRKKEGSKGIKNKQREKEKKKNTEKKEIKE